MLVVDESLVAASTLIVSLYSPLWLEGRLDRYSRYRGRLKIIVCSTLFAFESTVVNACAIVAAANRSDHRCNRCSSFGFCLLRLGEYSRILVRDDFRPCTVRSQQVCFFSWGRARPCTSLFRHWMLAEIFNLGWFLVGTYCTKTVCAILEFCTATLSDILESPLAISAFFSAEIFLHFRRHLAAKFPMLTNDNRKYVTHRQTDGPTEVNA